MISQRKAIQSLAGSQLQRLRCRYFSNTSPHAKTALVLGSNGALGSAIASHLKAENHDVIGADVYVTEKSSDVDAFIPLQPNSSISELTMALSSGIKDLFDVTDEALDAVICANGGFAIDEVGNNSQTHDIMMQMNYFPTVAASELCKDYMSRDDGLFVAFGAASVAKQNPSSGGKITCGMSAYAASKNSVHHFVQSFGQMTGKTLGTKKVKDDFKLMSMRKHRYLDKLNVIGILPVTLDTESNRDSMGNENFSSWTKTEDIAKEIGTWIATPDLRPNSGSLIKAVTKNGTTSFNIYR